jgi:hypothetical protein
MVAYFNARWIIVNAIITNVVLVITIIIIVIIMSVLLPCAILDKINVSQFEFTLCASQWFFKLCIMIPPEGYDLFQDRSVNSQQLFIIYLY